MSGDNSSIDLFCLAGVGRTVFHRHSRWWRLNLLKSKFNMHVYSLSTRESQLIRVVLLGTVVALGTRKK